MPFNPEQFGFEAGAAPWNSRRLMATRALDLMRVVNPILAYMAQDRQRQAELFIDRPDIRRTPSPIGIGTRIIPELPPGSGRRR